MQTVESVLEQINRFPQDEDILFDEPTHVYSHKKFPDKKFISVTTFVHHLFPEFDADSVIRNMMRSRKWKPGNEYYGMKTEEIKQLWASRGTEAADKGTIMHNNIESFMNQHGLPPDYTHQMLYERWVEQHDGAAAAAAAAALPPSIEWRYFLKFVQDFPCMVPFRTETRVFDLECGLAGSVDMIYKNSDGSLSIYDWKRSKEIKRENKYQTAIQPFLQHLPDCNFFHYSLQLNVYKAILEKNYGVRVKDLFLVVLHPLHENYLLIECADLQREVLALLEEQRLKKQE